jgi:hypothetical protein
MGLDILHVRGVWVFGDEAPDYFARDVLMGALSCL